MIFQDLDWVPGNHAQAEDRAYRLGQKNRVTVEYMLGEGTLDTYVAESLASKMALIQAVEMDEAPDASILAELETRLRRDQPVAVICHAGVRSWHLACWLIEAQGYGDVWNVQGGIDAWSVEVDPAVPRY